jgi:hypothetical protein
VGKYDALTGRLPRLPAELVEGNDKNRQYEVEQAKKLIVERTPASLVTQYADIRRECDEMDDKARELGLRREAMEQLLIEVYEGEGITNLNVKGVGALRTQYAPYTRVVDKELLREWCVEKGFAAQMTLPWMTLNSTVSEILLSGEDCPPGVDVYIKPKLVLTREK